MRDRVRLATPESSDLDSDSSQAGRGGGEGAGVAHAKSMRTSYAMALYRDADATLDDLREAVTTLEEIERTARRVLGGDHPMVVGIETCLQEARAELRARETPSS